MNKLRFIIIILVSGFISFSQNKKADSLKAVINSSKSDSVKFNALSELCTYYEVAGDYDKAFKMLDTLYAIGKRTKLQLLEGKAYTHYANYYNGEGDYKVALEYYFKAISIYEKQKYYFGICNSYSNMGNVYFYTGNINRAYEYYKKALSVYKTYNINDETTLANIYNNLGSSAASLSEFDLARKYFGSALGCFIKREDSISIAYAYNNLGLICQEFKQKDSAIDYLKKALDIKMKFGTKDDMKNGCVELGKCYAFFNNTTKSLNYFQLATDYIDTNNIGGVDVDIFYNLSQSYKKLKQTDKALRFLEKSYYYYNQLNKSDLKSNLNQIEVSFKNAKKHYEDSLLSVSKSQIQQLKINQQIGQLESEKKQRVLLMIGLVIVIIGIVLFYNRYKITKKQKEIIEAQKTLVEDKNHQITHQNDLLEEKQKEIIDSINYAQRIQNAVLTNEKVWEKVSPQHFILFQPKDIVSGDFYWAYNTPNNRSIWAVADCTGHGVPGAFMSMLGNSFLNQIVVENKIFNAAEILNKLRTKIIDALEKEGVNQNDGMDISLCVWNKLNNSLEFAGANNSLLIARDGEWIELAADKMPIGAYHGDLIPFSMKEVQLCKNDVVYMYTDGYADQFGGPKGKKFRYKELDNLLLKNAGLPMNEQYSGLKEMFLTWRGGLIQTDDVCIVGIKALT